MRTSQTLRLFLGPIELLHEQAGPGLLRLTQLGVFALWIVKLLLDPLWRLADLPHEFYLPTGILSFLPESAIDLLFTSIGLTLFYFLTLTTLALCLTQRAFPIFSVLAAALLTVYSCVVRSFGPAVHTDIPLLLAVYAFAGFACADYWQAKSAAKKSPPGAWSAFPLITIVALLCLSYCLVGVNRIIAGGPLVFTGDTIEVYALDASLRGYYFNTDIGWHVPEWPFALFMLKLGFPIITLFEIAAPLCLVSPHFRWIFIPTMLSFHLLSLIVMNIFFFDNMLLYLLLIDWSRKYPALRAARS